MHKTTLLSSTLAMLLSSFTLFAQPSGRQDFNHEWSLVQNTDKESLEFKYKMGLQAVELAPLVNTPHDWGTEKGFRQEYPGESGKMAWWGYARYWKHIILLKEDLKDKCFFLEIDGAMSNPKVFCNGKFAGEWAYGYSSFRVDLTPHMREGSNFIMIDLENPEESSRWYPGGGIYRNVWLTTCDPVGIGHWGTYITTEILPGNSAKANISVTLRNNTADSPSGILYSTLYKKEKDGSKVKVGKEIKTSIDSIKDGMAVNLSMEISDVKLWDINSPELYCIESTLKTDKYSDSYTTTFGVRTAEFTKDGFFLNGNKLKLNGVCLHHDAGALGAAWNTSAWERRLNMLKNMGCNAIRTSHNPPAPEFLDLCDKMGFVVIDELTDTWTVAKKKNGYATIFDKWIEKDLRSLIRRDRNHPSVILWSTGNEIAEQGIAEKHHISSWLSQICKEEDPSRLSTAGCDNVAASKTDWKNTIDVYGFNYKPYAYESFRAENPDKAYYSSESASTISSRGVYVFPVSEDKAEGKQDFQMSSYDLYAPYWACTPDKEFAAQDKCPWVAGEFVWTGFDYLGEPTPYNSDLAPSRSSYFGIIDLAGFPKDRYWLYQSRWRPDVPCAHILPHWNWEGREGEITPVMVYTSGDSAELFVNGKSQGLKTKGEYEYRLRWDDVVYEKGEVKVIAYKNGKVWAKDVVKTTGKAHKIVARAETGKGPGKDFGGDKPVRNSRRRFVVRDLWKNQSSSDVEYVYVDVKVADRKGNMVPTANNLLKFNISGPATIVATDAGDPTCHLPFSSSERPAFNGLCSVIIKVNGKGKIVLTAESEGIRSDKLTIISK